MTIGAWDSTNRAIEDSVTSRLSFTQAITDSGSVISDYHDHVGAWTQSLSQATKRATTSTASEETVRTQ